MYSYSNSNCQPSPHYLHREVWTNNWPSASAVPLHYKDCDTLSEFDGVRAFPAGFQHYSSALQNQKTNTHFECHTSADSDAQSGPGSGSSLLDELPVPWEQILPAALPDSRFQQLDVYPKFSITYQPHTPYKWGCKGSLDLVKGIWSHADSKAAKFRATTRSTPNYESLQLPKGVASTRVSTVDRTGDSVKGVWSHDDNKAAKLRATSKSTYNYSAMEFPLLVACSRASTQDRTGKIRELQHRILADQDLVEDPESVGPDHTLYGIPVPHSIKPSPAWTWLSPSGDIAEKSERTQFFSKSSFQDMPSKESKRTSRLNELIREDHFRNRVVNGNRPLKSPWGKPIFAKGPTGFQSRQPRQPTRQDNIPPRRRSAQLKLPILADASAEMSQLSSRKPSIQVGKEGPMNRSTWQGQSMPSQGRPEVAFAGTDGVEFPQGRPSVENAPSRGSSHSHLSTQGHLVSPSDGDQLVTAGRKGFVEARVESWSNNSGPQFPTDNRRNGSQTPMQDYSVLPMSSPSWTGANHSNGASRDTPRKIVILKRPHTQDPLFTPKSLPQLHPPVQCAGAEASMGTQQGNARNQVMMDSGMRRQHWSGANRSNGSLQDTFRKQVILQRAHAQNELFRWNSLLQLNPPIQGAGADAPMGTQQGNTRNQIVTDRGMIKQHCSREVRPQPISSSNAGRAKRSEEYRRTRQNLGGRRGGTRGGLSLHNYSSRNGTRAQSLAMASIAELPDGIVGYVAPAA